MSRAFCFSLIVIWTNSLFSVGSLVPHINPDPLPKNNQNIYYVDATDGNDDNSGTEDRPWRTIQKAASAVSPGDTVYVKGGTYFEKVIFPVSGEENSFISFAVYPGDTVVVDASGQDMEPWHGVFTLDQVSHIKVSGFRLINSAQYGVYLLRVNDVVIQNNYTYDTYLSRIGVVASQVVRIENNEVENCVNNGEQECITIAASSEVKVIGNEVHHDGAGDRGGEGIDIKDGSFNVLVKGNYVHDLQEICIYIDAWDTHTYNITVEGNRVHDCKNSGIALASERGGLLENVTIQNNVSYHNVQVGLTVADWDQGYFHPMRNIKIINNTFYNNGWTWGGGIRIANPEIENLIVRNNLFSQNNAFQILDQVGGPEVTIDHNLIDGFRGSEPGETRGSNYVEGDPRFVNAAGNNFRLQSNSPAIDQGNVSGAPSHDYHGLPRPVNGDWDIGAFEYREPESGTSIYLPLIEKS